MVSQEPFPLAMRRASCRCLRAPQEPLPQLGHVLRFFLAVPRWLSVHDAIPTARDPPTHQPLAADCAIDHKAVTIVPHYVSACFSGQAMAIRGTLGRKRTNRAE